MIDENKSGITIRNAEMIDAETISHLSGQLGYKTNTIFIQNRLSIILTNNDHCVFVAVENEKIVGWVHGLYALRVESDVFVEIGGLVVDENHRRKGIGKILVDKVTMWAKFKNCDIIRVRCNVKRLESHQFYQDIGFEINKEQKVFDKKLN